MYYNTNLLPDLHNFSFKTIDATISFSFLKLLNLSNSVINKRLLADDDTESIPLLFRLRISSLLIGLFFGITISFATSRFEEVLKENVAVAFFMPFIIYLSSSVGTQTQSIYSRDLSNPGKTSFKKYLIKESALGLLFGIIFAAITFIIVMLWFNSFELSLAISISIMGAIATAPVIALVVTEILELRHSDPAVGAGPIATVIQDTVSLVIYGLITSAILL